MWPGFGEVITHPNGFLFSRVGDGLKNYFNLGFYLRYDDGFFFSGVNYPYGEHLLYTDTHPLYALLLNFVDNHIVSIAPYSVAIINLSILAGMVIAAVVLFMILSHYKLPMWYAVIVALCITFLSPQWDRIHGHLSLSYGLILPVFWYLLIRQDESVKHRLRWTIMIFFYLLLVGGIHLYYIAICATFAIAYAAIQFASTWFKEGKTDYLNVMVLLTAVMLPLLVYSLLSAVTDFIPDRPLDPYGFYVYHASVESVFLPHYSSVSNLVGRFFNSSINWEGRAYIGTPPLLFSITAILFVLRYKFQSFEVRSQDLALGKFLLASVIVLIFSMCLPFRWGLQFITDFLSPLKQFRALGRFSWVFFYVVSVVTAIYLFALFQELKAKGLNIVASSLLTVLLCAWAFDAGAFFINHGPVNISPNDKLENSDTEYTRRFSDNGINSNDFQAIMSIPLVAVRTDKMTFDKDMSAHNEAMKCAFHTGLPLIQSSASRPSLSQTLSSIQLISSPMIHKDRIKDMNDKPLLLIHSLSSDLSQGELALTQLGSRFWANEEFALYSLPLSAFADSLAKARMAFETRLVQDSFELSTNLTCSPNCDGVILHDYNVPEISTSTFSGHGALLQKAPDMIIFDSSLTVHDSMPFEASFWLYIDPSFSGMPTFEYFYGDVSDQLSSAGRQGTRDISEVENGWVQISINLESKRYHKIVLFGSNITIDNLLIRPSSTDVFWQVDQKAFLNNYPL